MTHSISLFFGRNKPKHTKHVPDHDPPALGRHNSWSARWQQRRCHFQPHTYLLRPNTRCILQSFFFFLTPLVLRIVPGREQPCLGNGGILSFEGKKRYILKSNSLSKSKKVPHSKRLKWDWKAKHPSHCGKRLFFFCHWRHKTNQQKNRHGQRTNSVYTLAKATHFPDRNNGGGKTRPTNPVSPE